MLDPVLTGLACVMMLTTGDVRGDEAAWPQFRGPDSNPVSANARLAEKWGMTENIEWSVEIPGRGWSSPVVTGGKVFITAATTDGPSKPPQIGTEYSNEYVAELTKQGLSEALPIYLDFGTGSSPVLAGHLLVIVNDNEKPPFIAAYDTKTGNVTYKTRIDPSATAFTSSPWAYNGKGFFLGGRGGRLSSRQGRRFSCCA